MSVAAHSYGVALVALALGGSRARRAAGRFSTAGNC
jgi:5'-deoxynucleotidase YfbR-like HD superfamily hydrolase